MSMHDARSGPSAPEQSSPSVSRFVSIVEAYRSVCGPTYAGSDCDLYEISLRITQIDRAIIRGYLHECCLARAAAGAQDSPQGSKLRRPWMPGSILPPRAQKQSLPAKLERKLSTLVAGYERVLVDHNVLLVETATGEIVDVMRNACATDGLGRCVARERNRTPDIIDRSGSAFANPAFQSQLYERIANS